MAELKDYIQFFNVESLKGRYTEILDEVRPVLKQGRIRGVDEPRWTAGFAIDPQVVDFRYANRVVKPHQLQEETFPLLCHFSREVLDVAAHQRLPVCNALFVNWYPDPEKHSIGWHSDREVSASLRFVLSVTLNEETPRAFIFRRISEPSVKWTMDLDDGDVLAMLPGCQENFQHSLPKRKTNHHRQKVSGGRLNLTYRVLFTQKE